MSKKTTPKGILGPKALEMVMKDVIGGMEEFAIMKSYELSGEEYKIVSIRPTGISLVNDVCYDFYDEPEASYFADDTEKPLAEVVDFSEYKRKRRAADSE